jgi:hypothetical protein
MPSRTRVSLALARLRRNPIHATLLALAAVFFALHFLHLNADFPNHSPVGGLEQVHR